MKQIPYNDINSAGGTVQLIDINKLKQERDLIISEIEKETDRSIIGKLARAHEKICKKIGELMKSDRKKSN